MSDDDKQGLLSEHWLPIAVYGALAVAALIVFAIAWQIGEAIETALRPAPVAALAPPIVTTPVDGLARPPRGNIAQYFSADNYPPEAIRRNEQGRTVARLGVSADGSVSSCVVQQSSGSTSLDAATCGIARNRVLFDPARDSAGHPIASSFVLPVRWVLPQDFVPVARPARKRAKDFPAGPAVIVLAEGFVIGRALMRGDLGRKRGKPVVVRAEAPFRYWGAIAFHGCIAGVAMFGVLAWLVPV